MCTKNTTNKKVSNEIAGKIKGNAIKYMRFKDQLATIDPKEIEQYRSEIKEAYSRLWVQIEFVEHDPYKNLEEMTRGIHQTNTLFISNLNNDSALLPGTLNLFFRAVHDHLHYLLQQPFDFEGEYKVYQAQKLMHKSKIAKQILYSEIVLQAAYCTYFGKFADKQKIVL